MYQMPPWWMMPPGSQSSKSGMSEKKVIKLLREAGVIPKASKNKRSSLNVGQFFALLNICAPFVIIVQFLAVKFCLNQLLELANTLPHAH